MNRSKEVGDPRTCSERGATDLDGIKLGLWYPVYYSRAGADWEKENRAALDTPWNPTMSLQRR